MNRDEFLLLATRVLSGNDESGEQEQLIEYIAENKELAQLYEQFKRFWQSGRTHAGTNVEAALSTVWDRIRKEEETEESEIPVIMPHNRPKRIWWAVAASVLVLVIAGWWWMSGNRKSTSVQMVEAYNPKGVRSQIVLPDGSKVWLSADSRLIYPSVFAEGKRDLQLQGEAFFDVVQNPARPFEVHLDDGSVQVLGTSFNIRSYNGDAMVTASVASGKIAFRAKSNTNKLVLVAGKKAVYNKQMQKLVMEDTDPVLDKGWIDGTLVFNAESLESVARSLERYYGKKIMFLDNKPRSYRFTGTFMNKSQAEILHDLSKTKSFSFTVSDSAILIGK